MKQRPNAPWALEGSYRALQKLSSKRGPAPKYIHPPEPKMTVEDVIEKVHDTAANTFGIEIVCAMIHPENYHELLNEMHATRYQMPPEFSYFSENPGLPSTGPSSMYKVMGVMTGVGMVEVRSDMSINKGSILVVTK